MKDRTNNDIRDEFFGYIEVKQGLKSERYKDILISNNTFAFPFFLGVLFRNFQRPKKK